MGIRERVFEVMGVVPQARAERRAQEAYAAGFNDGGEDEPGSGGVKQYGYRRGGKRARDLSGMSQDRAIEAAYRLWTSTPMGWRLVELAVDFLVKNGVGVVCESPEVEEVVTRFWRVNEMDEQQELLVRELMLFGELCVRVFVRDGQDVRMRGDGAVRFGVVDPARIDQLVCDMENASDLVAIKLKGAAGERGDLLRVLRPDETTGQYTWSGSGRAEEGACVGQGWRVVEGGQVTKGDVFDEAAFDGACFYFAVNRIRRGNRGRPYLLPLVDWIDRDDQLFFDVLEWAAILRAFVWDLLIEGGDAATVANEVRRLRATKPGGVYGHNDKITLEAKNPNLHAADFEHLIRQLRIKIAGGAGYPEHWLAEGGYTNRATAQEMGAPTFTMLGRRSGYVRRMLLTLVRFAVDMAVAFGTLVAEVAELGEDGTPTGETIAARDVVDVVMPEISERDMETAAGAFGQVAGAAVMANAQGLLSDRGAIEILAAVAAMLGVTVDVVATLEEMGGAYEAGALEEALESVR